MPYKPTGRPPGRPKKASETRSEASVAPVESVPVHEAAPRLSPPPHGLEHAADPRNGELCKLCYPDGWQPGWTGIGCKHGSYFRRL
jgi:hypothetical protein